MIWTAWRTMRLSVLLAAVFTAAVMLWLGIGWRQLSDAQTAWAHACAFYRQLSNGQAPSAELARCNAAFAHEQFWAQWLRGASWILEIVPFVLGMLIGAPLAARDMQLATNRLMWTQSVGRSRWLAIRAGLGALATVALATCMLPVLDWFAHGTAGSSLIEPRTFDTAGVVVVGYALFAFALTTALGALVRSPIWGSALGAAAFLGTRVWVVADVRSHLASLRSLSSPATFFGFPTSVRGWVINDGYVPAGRLTPSPGHGWAAYSHQVDTCSNAASAAAGRAGLDPFGLRATQLLQSCMSRLHLHYAAQFQPDSHYWPLQIAEFAVFLALTATAVGGAFAVVRRWQA
jgi:hypothetical protein